MKITRKWLECHGACGDGKEFFLSEGKLDALEGIRNLALKKHWSWANWLMARVLDRKQKIQYAIFAAELVLDIFEKKYPHNKEPREAIEAAKKVLQNDMEANRKASAAASAAAYAASDAAYAADTSAAASAAAYAASAATCKPGNLVINDSQNPVTSAAAYAAYAASAAASDAASAASYAASAASAAANAASADASYAKEKLRTKILEYGLELFKDSCGKRELSLPVCKTANAEATIFTR